MSSDRSLVSQLDEAKNYLVDKLEGRKPRFAVVLGSGLNDLADKIEDAVAIDYASVPHMQVSTAQNHASRFVAGTFEGKQIIAMQGRLHGYEGYASHEVAFPIWLLGRIGVEVIMLTNAAGGINESFKPGDFCLMTDHINFMGRTPLSHPEAADLGVRFFSMTDAYEPALRKVMLEAAHESDVDVREGVYLGLSGPSFETPAEIRAFRIWGADTVAMSVIEEAIAARQVGMRLIGMSLVSNMAAGIEGASPSGEEVFETARAAAVNFERLMKVFLSKLDV